MNGQCSGHTSYMAIVTYYHGGVKTTFLNNERIQKMKHVQVGEVLANQKGGVYLKSFFPNGTDWTGRGKLSLRQKIKVGREYGYFFVCGRCTNHIRQPCENKPDGMHGSMDEMKLEAKEWSLSGFKIVVDEEWADYVRPDVNFVMSERGDA